MALHIRDFHQLATQNDIEALENRLNYKINLVLECVHQIRDDLSRHSGSNLGRKPKEFYTPKEFGELIGVSKNTVIRRCQDGTYRSTQPGGAGTAILIPCSELERIRERAEDLG